MDQPTRSTTANSVRSTVSLDLTGTDPLRAGRTSMRPIATAISRVASMTRAWTASALNCGLNRRRCSAGRPRTRPQRVLADKAYSHPSTRAQLRRRHIAFTSPERSDQIARRRAKGARGGRPPAFDPDLYTGRNVVERCFNRLKQFRALATRYAKRAAYYRTEIIIAAIVLWLRTDLQDTP
jgi:transposase